MQGRSKHLSSPPEWLEAAFLEEFLVGGATTPVSHYQACFPGHEATIGELFSRNAGEARATTTDEPPRIGRYLLRATVGRGGQGTVYRAYDPELDRLVAIKVGHPQDDEDSSSALRLVREARVGARLAHPGICPVLDHGIQDGAPYVVMPFLEGWSLRQLLELARKGEGSADQAGMEEVCAQLGLFVPGDGSSTSRGRQVKVVRFVERLASAMAVAHASGIVHRDLKPANILVRPNGDPVILDLGLAKDQNNVLPTLTCDHDLLGTPAYVAPEQLRMRGGIGPGADVWALGVVLTECLTGERPFPGPSREQLYRQILDANPRPLRERIGPVPRDLQVLVDVALQKDPRRRYASARELAGDLQRFNHKLPIQARAPGPLARLWLWTRRKPTLAATVLGLFLSLVAAVVAMVFLLREQARNAELAQQRYDAMRAVSHDIVFDLVGRLGSVPGTAQVRRKLADKAIEYLEILHRENPGDREVQRQIILARFRLGDALGSPTNQDLGMPEAAIKQFRLARGAIVKLEQAPGQMLADCDSRLGSVLLSLGRFAEARTHLRWTREYREALEASGKGSLQDLEHLFGAVAELSTCAQRLGEPDRARELETEAIAVADRLVARAHADDPLAFESVAQTVQVACVLRQRQGRLREALDILRDMYPRVKDLADRYPERERLQHSAIVFGSQIGELLMMARRVDDARPAFEDALRRLEQGQQHGLDEANQRLRLQILFEYGRGLTNSGLLEEGLRHLDRAEKGCQAILSIATNQPEVRKLYRHVRMHKSLAHADAGRSDTARKIIGDLAAQYLGIQAEWTEERLRDRGQVMLTQVQVLATARDHEAARKVLARELVFFREHRSGDVRDKVCVAMARSFENASRKLKARRH